MADALIALGGNVGDVRATFQKAIANICGMTQGALLARSSDYSTPPWGDEETGAFHQCLHRDRDQPRSPRPAVYAAQDREEVRPRSRARDALGSAHARPRPDRLRRCQNRQARADAAAPPAVRTGFRAGAARRDCARTYHCRTQRCGGAGAAFGRWYPAVTRPRLTEKVPKQPFGLAAAPWQFPAKYKR